MADNLLTRRYGGVPGWAIGGGVGVAALLFWYFRSRGQSQAQAATGPLAGSLPAGIASSSYPYVPSSGVTGLLPGASAPSASASSLPPSAGTVPDTPCQSSDWQLQGSGYRYTPGDFIKGGMRYSWISSGGASANLLAASPASVFYFPVPCVPMPFGQGQGLAGPVPQYLQAPVGSGSGGYSQAGQSSPAPFFGWTMGWMPAPGGTGGAGASSTVNRTGTARRGRPQRPVFPMRRRALSGR